MIQTVTGKVVKQIKGNILLHEHVQCISNDMLHLFGDKWADREQRISYSVALIKLLKEKYGVELFVDGTPIDLGRDVRLLAEVSRRSGVNIVASTGLYMYPAIATVNKKEENIADWFLEEIQNGMESTVIKPGILKCAIDDYGITPENEKRIGALGRVQKKTGLPLYVHCLHKGEEAKKALRILHERGANLDKIVVGHTARCSYEYIKGLLEQSCYVCMDQCHIVPDRAANIAEILVRLHENGYGDKLLLSNDSCIYSDFCAKGGEWIKIDGIENNFGFIFGRLRQEFYRFGGDKTSYQKMLNENTLNFLTM